MKGRKIKYKKKVENVIMCFLNDEEKRTERERETEERNDTEQP